MPQVLSILFGAAFTVTVSMALGTLLVRVRVVADALVRVRPQAGLLFHLVLKPTWGRLADRGFRPTKTKWTCGQACATERNAW